jgi:DNA-binding response OmpR family regulator
MTNNPNDKKEKRILLVDDELDITRLVRMVLENSGFVVDVYTDPILALSHFKAGSYDLILLDIRMPEINGLELYQKMKQIDNNAKVCFLTASELFYEEYRRLEAHSLLDKAYFIQKPFRTEEMVDQIKAIIFR